MPVASRRHASSLVHAMVGASACGPSTPRRSSNPARQRPPADAPTPHRSRAPGETLQLDTSVSRIAYTRQRRRVLIEQDLVRRLRPPECARPEGHLASRIGPGRNALSPAFSCRCSDAVGICQSTSGERFRSTDRTGGQVAAGRDRRPRAGRRAATSRCPGRPHPARAHPARCRRCDRGAAPGPRRDTRPVPRSP
jgi:hypothetical protein